MRQSSLSRKAGEGRGGGLSVPLQAYASSARSFCRSTSIETSLPSTGRHQ